MDWSQFAGAALGSIFSLGGSLFSNDYNQRQFNRSLDFQRQERERAQQWQEQFWSQQFNASNAEYDRRLRDERAYNTPQAQLERMRATGYAPDMLQGAGPDSTFGVPQSVASPTSPSISTSTPPYQSTASPTEGVLQIASAFGSLAKAGLDTANKDRINTLLADELQSLKLDNEYKVYQNFVEANVKDIKVKKSFADLNSAYAYASYLGALGDEAVWSSLLKEQQRLESIARRNMTDEQFKIFQKVNEKWYQRFREESEIRQSEAARNRSEVGKNNNLAKFFGEQYIALHSENIVNTDPEVISKRKQIVLDNATKLKGEIELDGSKRRELNELVDKLRNENDVFYVNLILSHIERLLDSGANVAKALK